MKLPIIAATLLLAACATQRTTIESTWIDADYSGPPLDRVAVAALFPTRADSLAFERSAADYLETHGVATVPAHELLPSAAAAQLDETDVRKHLAGADVDGVLIFRLVAIDERREYQVPTPYLLNGPSPAAASDPAFPDQRTPSYYWFAETPTDAPVSQGYWLEQTFVVAETALFDNRTDRLLWTAKSETLDAARFELTAESIVRTVARSLFEMDLVAPSEVTVRARPSRSRN
jgi:hypothetical protein